MGREELSKDDQEQLEYIDKWYELKREKEYQKQERKRGRKMYLNRACYHMCMVLVELGLYFKLQIGRAHV